MKLRFRSQAGTHTDRTGSVCEASCLGPRLCVWAKESTGFHITHAQCGCARRVTMFSSAVSTLASQNRKEPRDKGRGFFLKSESPLFPLISHNRTMCSICPTVPSVGVCVCMHGSSRLVLCQHQTRRGWKNTHWFSVPFYLSASSFFTIRYDNLLQGRCSTWEKTHSVKFTNTVSAELASLSALTHTHKQSAAYKSACVCVLLRFGLRCLAYPLTF